MKDGKSRMLYLALIPGDYIGWGVCSKYLIKEIGKRLPVKVIRNTAEACRHYRTTRSKLDGSVIHTIGDHRLMKVIDITGTENFGYTFFENVLPAEAVRNAAFFDIIFAGSSWCRNRLAEAGIHRTEVLIQGIDPELFFPINEGKTGAQQFFVIFSGGKFELRKGQDIVIRAISVLQKRHSDILFVNCWHNLWPFSLNTMVRSPHISFLAQKRWNADYLQQLMHESGIDLERTITLPRIPQNQLRKIYGSTDIGLFPNRCEGGTNLVLMEYMACGKPVIATYTSGHRDILTADNSIQLSNLAAMSIKEPDGSMTAHWETPSLDDVVDALEYAYQNPEEIRCKGEQAGRDLAELTWQRTAADLLFKIGKKPEIFTGSQL